MKQLVFLMACLGASVSSFALNPTRDYKATPDDYGMKYKEIIVTTDDNIQLNTWVFNPAKLSKKYIIISASGDGNMSDNIEIAAQFLSDDFNVIMYDYRGYGKSSDFKINPNFYIYSQFQKDLAAECDYARKYYNTQF